MVEKIPLLQQINAEQSFVPLWNRRSGNGARTLAIRKLVRSSMELSGLGHGPGSYRAVALVHQ